jgi:hypothetical protein
MPRNPNKKQCTKPKCHNYAMRGRLLCRSHLDHELGPRGAGAPTGNPNALTDGFATLPLATWRRMLLQFVLKARPMILPTGCFMAGFYLKSKNVLIVFHIVAFHV